MINKETKLPISVIALAVSMIGGSIWTASEVFTRFETLEKQVSNEQAYDDAWIRKLSDDNMNKIIVLETKMHMLVTPQMEIVPSQKVGENTIKIDSLRREFDREFNQAKDKYKQTLDK